MALSRDRRRAETKSFHDRGRTLHSAERSIQLSVPNELILGNSIKSAVLLGMSDAYRVRYLSSDCNWWNLRRTATPPRLDNAAKSIHSRNKTIAAAVQRGVNDDGEQGKLAGKRVLNQLVRQ